jgi:hypothetical protein
MLYDVGWIDSDVKMLYITDLHTADREEDLYVCTLFSLDVMDLLFDESLKSTPIHPVNIRFRPFLVTFPVPIQS